MLTYEQLARFVNHSDIHVTFGSKRSDGSEVRALEGARMRHQRPCRRPLRPERAASTIPAIVRRRCRRTSCSATIPPHHVSRAFATRRFRRQIRRRRHARRRRCHHRHHQLRFHRLPNHPRGLPRHPYRPRTRRTRRPLRRRRSRRRPNLPITTAICGTTRTYCWRASWRVWAFSACACALCSVATAYLAVAASSRTFDARSGGRLPHEASQIHARCRCCVRR
jgi:hypothetical protein